MNLCENDTVIVDCVGCMSMNSLCYFYHSEIKGNLISILMTQFLASMGKKHKIAPKILI